MSDPDQPRRDKVYGFIERMQKFESNMHVIEKRIMFTSKVIKSFCSTINKTKKAYEEYLSNNDDGSFTFKASKWFYESVFLPSALTLYFAVAEIGVLMIRPMWRYLHSQQSNMTPRERRLFNDIDNKHPEIHALNIEDVIDDIGKTFIIVMKRQVQSSLAEVYSLFGYFLKTHLQTGGKTA